MEFLAVQVPLFGKGGQSWSPFSSGEAFSHLAHTACSACSPDRRLWVDIRDWICMYRRHNSVVFVSSSHVGFKSFRSPDRSGRKPRPYWRCGATTTRRCAAVALRDFRWQDVTAQWLFVPPLGRGSASTVSLSMQVQAPHDIIIRWTYGRFMA